MKHALNYTAILTIGALTLSCQETLPTYVSPQNILSVTVAKVEQLNDRVAPPGNQAVRIVLSGENIFDDVFYDSVNIRGSIRIWWKRKPVRYRTLTLTSVNFVNKELIHNGKMLLSPGQQFSVETFWNLKSDDSLYLPTEMNFAYLRRRVCYFNVACADPETFVLEASLNVYDKIGLVAAPPTNFTFVGREFIN